MFVSVGAVVNALGAIVLGAPVGFQYVIFVNWIFVPSAITFTS